MSKYYNFQGDQVTIILNHKILVEEQSSGETESTGPYLVEKKNTKKTAPLEQFNSLDTGPQTLSHTLNTGIFGVFLKITKNSNIVQSTQ